jgi:two-component system, OmpR family, alkaline phosphatase synthesis response regulator PhoP
MQPREAEPNYADVRVLVVDDEARLVNLVRMNLEMERFRVIEASNGLEALDMVRRHIPEMIILDIMMPQLDGFETLRMLREFSSVPVIMLTAKGEEEDIVKGLALGADDYMTKPFGPRELVSRVKAVLRRVDGVGDPGESILKIDDRLSIDFNKRQVIVNGEPIKLRPTEYRLLYHLIENVGWTITHEQILAKVWGYEYRDETHYVRLYINYLREKIEEDPANPKYILTERGTGYRFMDYRKNRA